MIRIIVMAFLLLNCGDCSQTGCSNLSLSTLVSRLPEDIGPMKTLIWVLQEEDLDSSLDLVLASLTKKDTLNVMHQFASKENIIEKLLDMREGSAGIVVFSLTPPGNDLLTRAAQFGLLHTFVWYFPHSQRIMDIDVHILRLDSKLFTFTCQLEIKEIYGIKGSKKIIKDISNLDDRSIWERRADLSGITLVNTVLPYNLITNLAYDKDGNVSSTGGFLTEVLRSLQDVLKFEVKWVSPPDGAWGLPDENGTWSGMVKMLMDKEADICTAGLTVLEARASVIDFTMNLFEDKVAPILKRKDVKTQPVGIKAFFQVFDPLAWIGIAASCALLSTGFYAANFVHGLHLNGQKFGVLNSLGVVFAILCQKDYSHLNKREVSTKIVFLVTCLFTLLIYSTYSARLTSVMTIRSEIPPINSLDTLIEQNRDVFGFAGSASIGFLENSPEGSEGRRLFEYMKKSPETMFVKGPKEAESRLLSNENAVLYTFSLGYAKKRDFTVVDLPGSLASYQAIGVGKGSEFLHIFNYYLQKIHESGLIQKKRHDWIKPEPVETDGSRESESLGYQSLILPFALVLIGLFGGFVLLSFEKCSRIEANLNFYYNSS